MSGAQDTGSEPRTYEGEQIAFIEIEDGDELAAALGAKAPDGGFTIGGSDEPGTYRLIRETEDTDEQQDKNLVEDY